MIPSKRETKDGINLVYGPGVYVIGKQMIDQGELAVFLQDEGFPEWQTTCKDLSKYAGQVISEIAARTCYRSFNGKGRSHDDNLRHVLEVSHGSILEHCVFTLAITGVSRSLTHELIRHRAGLSPSQESQRYVNAKDVAFVVPPLMVVFGVSDGWMRNRRDELKQYVADDEALLVKLYEHVTGDRVDRMSELDGKIRRLPLDVRTSLIKHSREAARSNLPNAAETRIVLTGNARMWRHFIEQRGSEHADAEIRRLANAVYEEMVQLAPILFSDYIKSEPLLDGTYTLKTLWEKV